MENQKNNTIDNTNANLEELKKQAIKAIDFYFSSEENQKNKRLAPSMIVNAYGDLGKINEVKTKIIKEYEKFPEVFADVVSSLDNPNCSCRSRFAFFIEENEIESVLIYKNIINSLTKESEEDLSKVLSLQNNFFESFKKGLENKNENTGSASQLNDQKSQKPDQANEPFPVYLEGNVIEIQNSVLAYGELIKNLRQNGEHFRGLNLIEKPDNKLWVYFY